MMFGELRSMGQLLLGLCQGLHLPISSVMGLANVFTIRPIFPEIKTHNTWLITSGIARGLVIMTLGSCFDSQANGNLNNNIMCSQHQQQECINNIDTKHNWRTILFFLTVKMISILQSLLLYPFSMISHSPWISSPSVGRVSPWVRQSVRSWEVRCEGVRRVTGEHLSWNQDSALIAHITRTGTNIFEAKKITNIFNAIHSKYFLFEAERTFKWQNALRLVVCECGHSE